MKSRGGGRRARWRGGVGPSAHVTEMALDAERVRLEDLPSVSKRLSSGEEALVRLLLVVFCA